MSKSHLTGLLRRIAFVVTFLVTAIMCLAPPSRGAETQVPEEWIFSVVLPPQWSIAEAVFAYEFKGAFYLPIIELAEAYEFFVEAETGRVFVTGFAGREENSYSLDGEQGTITVKGVSEPLPVDALIPQDVIGTDDIYVQIEVLNRLWPVEMRVELSRLTVVVTAEEELSFVRRRDREDRRAQAEARKALVEAQNSEIFPLRENPYQWFSAPVIDLQNIYTYNNRTRELTGTNNISGVQHLGKFIADFSGTYNYIDGKLRRPDSIRARFLRQAVDEEDLLIPGLKRIEFGDITLGQRALIGNNSGGRGLIISNAPSSKTREFDRITVEGTGPPGWELELYNNNELLEFGVIEDDGEYRFENVILNFGNNRIRVIQYGPQGQIREVVEEFDVAGSLNSPGEFRYRAGVVDTDRALIPLEDVTDDQDQLVSQNAEASYGLNKWLTLFGSYTQTPRDGEQEKYYTIGTSVNTPLGFGSIEGYKNINGGSALDTRFVTELLGVRLNMRGAVFSKFESDIAGTGRSARRLEGEVQANTTLPLPFVPLGLSANILHRETYDGLVTTTLTTSQSFSGGGLRFGHGTTSRLTNEEHETSSGDFNASWGRGDWTARGAMNYTMHPETDLSSATGEIRYNPQEAFQAAVNFNHNFPTSVSTINGQIGYDFKDILSTIDAGYQRERGWQFILRATTSLHPFSPNREYRLSSTTRRNQSNVLGRVFIDRDGDNVFSDGDEPIENARLRIGNSRSNEESGPDGVVITTLRPDFVSAVRVDESSLEDPYLKPSIEGYRTTGLRGAMPGFDFPIVETGAIDGTVVRDSSGAPVAGMQLELVRPDGSVFMTARTAFDGYYAFEFVVPGTYTVRADPTYEVNVPAETVTVSSEELFAFGVDLYLLEPAAEESAADQADGGGRIAQFDHAPAVPGTEQPAPVSPHGEGSSLAAEETSDEDSAPVAESSVDGGSSPVGESDSSGDASSVGLSIVKDVRIGETPEGVRFVLDLTAPASYDINEGDGLIVLIDLPGSLWDTVPAHEFSYSKILQGYTIEALPGKGTRLILKARAGMTVTDHKLIAAADGKSDRLIIDFAAR